MKYTISILCVLTSQIAMGATDTWSGTTSSSWSVGGVGGNWTNGAAPVSTDSLIFPNVPATTSNNNIAGLNLNSITINSPLNYDITGNQINLSSISVNAGGGAHIFAIPINMIGDLSITQLAAGNHFTMQGNITSGGGVSFTKLGPGTLTLTGDNSGFVGTLSINNGTVDVGTAQNLGSGAIVLSDGTTLHVTGTFTTGQSITFPNAPANATIAVEASQDFTLTGATAGAFTLNKGGPGTLTLTGANNYTQGTNIQGGILSIGAAMNLGSGTVTFFNSELQVTGGSFSLNQPIAITSGTFAIFDIAPGNNTALLNQITGDNMTTMTVQNGGILSLINTNDISFQGNLNIINGATVQVQTALNLNSSSATINLGGGTLSILSPTTINQNMTLNSGGGVIGTFMPVTLNGVITGGAGNDLTLTHGPPLIFNNNMTYSGLTSITGTTILRAGQANAFSPNSRVFVNSLCTLDLNNHDNTIANLSGDGNVTLGTGNLTLGDSTDQVFNGSISGNGILNKNGSGKLTLSGSSNYTGPTDINFGKIIVDGTITSPVQVFPGAFLGGKGFVGSVTNDGTVGPGDSIGRLSVIGNYVQHADGTLEIEIDPNGTGDLLDVSGTAFLDGTLVVIPDPGIYTNGQTFVIVHTAPGGVMNHFATYQFLNNLPLSVQYLSDEVILTVLEQSLALPNNVRHHNPRQVLDYLDSLSLILGTDLFNVVNDLLHLSDPTSALDQLHPAIFGAFDLLNISTNALITSILTDQSSKLCYCNSESTSFWLAPFGSLISQRKIGEQIGFSAKEGGILGGFDFSPGQLAFGVGIGYAYQDIDWNQNRGFATINGGYLGVYANWVRPSFSLDAVLLGGINHYEGTRKIHFGSINRRAKHSSNGYDFTAHVGGNANLWEWRCIHFEPFVNLDYDFLDQKGFKEHGAESLNLAVETRKSNMLRSELGISATRSYTHSCYGCFSPTFWLSCVNEAYLVTKHYESHLRGEPGEFTVRTWNKPQTFFSPGFEFSFTTNNNASFAFRYSAEFNNKTTIQKGNLLLEWRF